MRIKGDDPPRRGPVTETSARDGLDAAVSREIRNGGRLKSRAPNYAIVVYGSGSGNVLLHITFAALTLVVSLLFVFPWIVWANTIRERQVTIHVDPHGNIIRSG
jgi:hypothetical protein